MNTRILLALCFLGLWRAMSSGAEPKEYLVLWPSPSNVCKQPLAIELDPETSGADENLFKSWTFDVRDPASHSAVAQRLWRDLDGKWFRIVVAPEISKLIAEVEKQPEVENSKAPKRIEVKPGVYSEMAEYSKALGTAIGRKVHYEPVWLGVPYVRGFIQKTSEGKVYLAIAISEKEDDEWAAKRIVEAMKRWESKPDANEVEPEKLFTRLWNETVGTPPAKLRFDAQTGGFRITAQPQHMERLVRDYGAL